MAQIIVKSGAGEELGTFQADSTQSLTAFGASSGVLIPVACGMGACGICAATVETGMEFLDNSAFGTGGFPTTEDQVLTCISAVKDDTPTDAKIILSLSNA